MLSRKLPATANLDNLKKRAKAIVKAAKGKEPGILSRIKPYFSNPAGIRLQDAQLVVAREYGFSSWNKLKTHVEAGHPAAISTDQIANSFLRYVVLLYSETETARPERWDQAKQLLDQHPEILDENIYVASAAGDIERIQRWLDKNPALVNKKGGHFNWEPLMYATYSRLPGVSTYDAGKVLLERGANPAAFYRWGGQYKFTALTGNYPFNMRDCHNFSDFYLSCGATSIAQTARQVSSRVNPQTARINQLAIRNSPTRPMRAHWSGHPATKCLCERSMK